MQLASAGCLVRRRKLDSASRPGSPLLAATLEQLAGSLQQRYEAIQTLNATVDLEPSLISTGKGEIADYKDVRGYILIRKPAWIRMIALYPIVRGTAFDMVSDGETFRAWLAAKNLFLMGRNQIEKPSPKRLENLPPQHMLQALLVEPPNPASEQAVIESWMEAGAARYILYILRKRPGGGLALARKIWFDRATLEVVRQQVFDPAGDQVTDARYGRWERRDGVLFPGHIIITRPKDEYELSIRFLKTVFNEEIAKDRFDLPAPPGAKVQRVGQEQPAT